MSPNKLIVPYLHRVCRHLLWPPYRAVYRAARSAAAKQAVRHHSVTRMHWERLCGGAACAGSVQCAATAVRYI